MRNSDLADIVIRHLNFELLTVSIPASIKIKKKFNKWVSILSDELSMGQINIEKIKPNTNLSKFLIR